jgi:hypothetical protein
MFDALRSSKMNRKEKEFKIVSNLFKLFTYLFLISFPSYLFSNTFEEVSYSFFADGGETESVFIIDGRNFPVQIGSVGLKASFLPSESTELYGKVGLGYSQKQSVSAYNFNLSGSVFATSFGGGLNRKFPIGDSNFTIMPFADVSIFNYYSDTFRGDRDGELLKANVKGNSTFSRGGVEMQYLTQNGHFFFGGGLTNWDIENEISIKTNNLTITPKVWADNVDSFFQAGVVFGTGNSDAIIGMRLSDLTFDINTQLIEVFAEIKISFGK